MSLAKKKTKDEDGKKLGFWDKKKYRKSIAGWWNLLVVKTITKRNIFIAI